MLNVQGRMSKVQAYFPLRQGFEGQGAEGYVARVSKVESAGTKWYRASCAVRIVNRQ